VSACIGAAVAVVVAVTQQYCYAGACYFSPTTGHNAATAATTQAVAATVTAVAAATLVSLHRLLLPLPHCRPIHHAVAAASTA